MSRAKNHPFLLRASLLLIPLLIACGSSPKPAPATAADQTDTADAAGDEASNSADSGKKADSESTAGDEKSDKKSESKSDKKADAEEDGDAPPVDDSRTTESVNKIFKENRKSFKKCYEEVRKDKPELKGNIVLKVVLDGDGQVKKAYVEEGESSIHEQKINDCMIKLAKSLTYPKSSKGLEKDFEYDFGFNNLSK